MRSIFLSFLVPIGSFTLANDLDYRRASQPLVYQPPGHLNDDDDVGVQRNLRSNYIEPSYWQRYRDQYDRRIKRCKFLQNVIPATGSECQRMKTGDYTCLFGEMACPDGSTHPTQTCNCDQPARKFQCQPFSGCAVFDTPAATCPTVHPATTSRTVKCSSIGLTCNYGSQTCCNGQTFETSSCVCGGNGLFKCTNNSVCRTESCPPPLSKAEPGSTSAPAPTPTVGPGPAPAATDPAKTSSPISSKPTLAARPRGGAAGVLSTGEKVSAVPVTASVKYSINFTNLWSGARHPVDYPSSAHWSPPVVAAHNSSFQMWTTGVLSTPGVQEVAETGDTSILQSEMDGRVGSVSIGRAMFNRAEQSQTIPSIELSPTSNLISTISMIAPSPDWFTGFSALYPETDGYWWSSFSILTYPFDAGTDSGTTYSSPNLATNPATPIFQIDETNSAGPFVNNGAVLPIGRWTFKLQQQPTDKSGKARDTTTISGPTFFLGAPAVTPAMSPAENIAPALMMLELAEPTFTQDLSKYLAPSVTIITKKPVS